jgi:choline dehydrogenase-like flavoprotein
LRYTAPGSAEFNDMQLVMFSHVDVATPARAPPIASAEPRGPPVVKLDFAADPEDLRRLVAGVRLAWEVAHQPEIARHTDHVDLLTEEIMSSDQALATYVRATVTTQFHPVARRGWAPRTMRRP